MPAFVNNARKEVNLASQDEFPEKCHRPFRRVGHYAVATIREPFELHEDALDIEELPHAVHGYVHERGSP